MALVHKFIAVWEPSDKGALHREDVYEYIQQGIIKKYASIEISDDVIQNILYDTSGSLLPDIKFNYWGITVYQERDLKRWMDFLDYTIKNNPQEYKRQCQDLIEFIAEAYVDKKCILHFGI